MYKCQYSCYVLCLSLSFFSLSLSLPLFHSLSLSLSLSHSLSPSLSLSLSLSPSLSQVETHAPVLTFASPTFSSFLDVLLSCAVFLALTLACFLYALVTAQTPPATTLGIARAPHAGDNERLDSSVCVC